MSKKRHKLPKKHSKKLFSKTAKKVHTKNGIPAGTAVMRGGIRF